MDEKQIQVVIIDRSQTLIELLIDSFNRVGIEADARQTSLAGLQLIHDTIPSVIIVDSVVDELSGFDIIKYIKTKFEDSIKTIVYTSSNDPKDIIYAEITEVDKLYLKGRDSYQKLVDECLMFINDSNKNPMSVNNNNYGTFPGDCEVLGVINNIYNKELVQNQIIEVLFSIISITDDLDSLFQEYFYILFDYFNVHSLSIVTYVNNNFVYYELSRAGFLENCSTTSEYDRLTNEFIISNKLSDKDIIRKKTLTKYKGRRKEAADELRISERTLYRKIKQYDL